jgi:hypothetical protein
MRVNKSLFLVSVIAALAAGALVLPAVNSALTFYSFEIITPAEVLAQPGTQVTVDGGVLVTGMYWMHDFNLTVEGLPYGYTIKPAHMDDVPILRDWNPQQGVFRVPNNFTLKMDIPANASGVYIVSITGTEHRSFRQVTNGTYFVLKVGKAAQNATAASQLQVSDILVPEAIKEFEPFNLTFKVDNNAAVKTAATITLVMPKEWQSDATSKTFSIEASGSAIGSFRIVPTTAAGEVSLMIEYPFKNQIINFTKTGPYLIPGENVTTTTKPSQPSGGSLGVIGGAVSAFTSFVSGALGSAGTQYDSWLTPITIGIIVILVIVIVWLLGGIFKLVQAGGRGEPESIKQVDVSSAELKSV